VYEKGETEMNKVLILIAMGVLCFSMIQCIHIGLATSGPPVEWSKTFGGVTADSEQSVVQTSDGGYAIASWGWLIKTDSTGNAQWNKTYGDRAVSLVQTSDGGYAVVGNTIIGGYGIAWLAKTDSSGNMQWKQSYTEIGMQATAWSLIQTNDGGYVIAGCKEYYDGWLMKTDANGTMQWSRSFVEANNTQLQSVVQTNDGGYVAAGATQFPPFSGKVDAYVVKTDADGNTTWSKEFSRTAGNDYGRSIVQTSDGGYAIAGETDHWGNADFWLTKTDASGNFLWDRTYGGAGWDGANSIVQTSDGGYALAGQTNSFGAGGNDFWLVKTDAEGNMQWNQTFGGAGDDGSGAVGSSLVQTHDSGYVLAGYTNSFSGDGSYEVWLIKLAGPIRVSMSPLSALTYAGQSVAFTSTTSGGVPPYNYQWYMNGSAVSGATSNSWAFALQPIGNYSVYLNVTDSLGSIAKSNEASVTVASQLTVSISPMSASILVGQSVTFTSTASGGYLPYSYQWYLNGNPVSSVVASIWTFTPSTSGICYVYLRVADINNSTVQSETARTAVASVPVGGYSVATKGYSTTKPLTFYLALVAILTTVFTSIKRKTKKEASARLTPQL
jgi:hypothetical protein